VKCCVQRPGPHFPAMAWFALLAYSMASDPADSAAAPACYTCSDCSSIYCTDAYTVCNGACSSSPLCYISTDATANNRQCPPTGLGTTSPPSPPLPPSAACDSIAHAACSASFQVNAGSPAMCGFGPASFFQYDACTNRTMCYEAIGPSMREAVAKMCSAEPTAVVGGGGGSAGCDAATIIGWTQPPDDAAKSAALNTMMLTNPDCAKGMMACISSSATDMAPCILGLVKTPPDAACEMPTLMEFMTQHSQAVVTNVMATKPKCGACLTVCARLNGPDQQACSIHCATASAPMQLATSAPGPLTIPTIMMPGCENGADALMKQKAMFDHAAVAAGCDAFSHVPPGVPTAAAGPLRLPA
jgi:hypothetical protein